jgi:hypothetical protein
VAKVQVSAALEIPDPAGSPGRVEALRRFDEPRWLHQCGGRTPLGTWRRAADLPELFADREAWLRCAPWRVHFHAPVHAAEVAGVPTTRDLVAPAIRAALEGGGDPPVLEVETYTWRAMPGFGGSDADLAREIAAELRFAAEAADPSRISGGPAPGGRESPP